MKQFSVFFALVYLFVLLVPRVWAEDAPEGTYDWYMKTTESFCKKGDWSQAVSNPLIEIDPVIYPSLEDANSDGKFRSYINAIKGDTSELDAEIDSQLQSVPIAWDIEKAAAVYIERMDAIYDCAAYNTMLRSQKDILSNKLGSISLSPNFSKEMERKNNALTLRMKERKCRNVSEVGPSAALTFKKLLADQTTLEYCNYRHYLYYVDYNVKNKLGTILETMAGRMKKTGKTPLFTSDSDKLGKDLANLSIRAESEMEKIQDSYKLAFDAFKEFERDYTSHVLSLAIISKLTEIRQHLDATANPLSQLLELWKGAQSTG